MGVGLGVAVGVGVGNGVGVGVGVGVVGAAAVVAAVSPQWLSFPWQPRAVLGWGGLQSTV